MIARNLLEKELECLCQSCPLKNAFNNLDFVSPEISEDSEILFVGESPGFDEIKFSRPFVGKSGLLLRRNLPKDILSKSAFSNTVLCHPKNYQSIRKPFQEEIGHCSKYTKDLIKSSKIHTVVLLGEVAARAFLPDELTKEQSITALHGKTFHVDNLKYCVFFHPSYILRKNNSLAENEYAAILNEVLGSDDNLTRFFNYPVEIKVFESLNNLREFLNLFEDSKDIALDYETRCLDTFDVSNGVLGFSLSTDKKSAYISFDRDLYPEEKEALLQFFKSRRIWTYNAHFEIGVTWNLLGEYLEFHDAFTLCKIDQSVASLKVNARKYLQAQFWEEIIYELVTAIKKRDIQTLQKYMGAEEISALAPSPQYYLDGVPLKYLAYYCCYDSYYTYLLKNKLYPQYKDCYYAYISQTWLASMMEIYGVGFDETRAKELEKFYTEEGVKALVEVISRISDSEELKLQARDIANSSSSGADKIARLKRIFNPASTSQKGQEPFWKALLTKRVSSMLLIALIKAGISGSPNLPLSVMDGIEINLDNEDEVKRIAEEIMRRIPPGSRRALLKVMSKIPEEFKNKTSSFRGENAEFIFQAFNTVGRIDVDNRETWTPEFELFFNLRYFKKVTKSLSTYVNGSVGRAGVWICEPVQDIRIPPKRIKKYLQATTEEIDNAKLLIQATQFMENAAATKRWRSAFHTVPWDCELRELYSVRLPDTLIVHYDYSQMEIRVLAFLSGDEALIKAFKDGADIHRFIAAQIWGIPESEVQPYMRRFSKMASFSLLYGKTAEGFAETFMNSDFAGAKKIFDGFFKAFPRVKEFIDKCHEQVKSEGRVSTIFGDYLNFDFNTKDINSIMRESQNYPIQSSASSLAAYGAYVLSKACRGAGLRTIPIVFTHDSCDTETYVGDLVSYIKMIKAYAEDFIRDQYGVPVKVDCEFGLNQNNNMKLEQIFSISDNVLEAKFSCIEDNVPLITDRIRLHNDVDLEIESVEETSRSNLELFVAKRAFSIYIGKSDRVAAGKIRISKKT